MWPVCGHQAATSGNEARVGKDDRLRSTAGAVLGPGGTLRSATNPLCDRTRDEAENASDNPRRDANLEHGEPGRRRVGSEAEDQSHDTADEAEDEAAEQHARENRHLPKLSA
ncbi:MAG: hypothetical protein JWR85_2723 [Marmoricola sp.]|nr:hypothetical protein [Marmoricola sp.]